MILRFHLLATVSIAALIAGAPGARAEEASLSAPSGLAAVSAINGKISGFGGVNADDPIFGAAGALAVPLGDRFGTQIDGVVGSADDDLFWGIGGHAFWRDPGLGLLGIYAGYAEWDASGSIAAPEPAGAVADIIGSEVGKVGLEAEAYLSRVSLEGFAGYQFGTEEGLAARGTFAFYPLDDLRLDISLRHLEGPGLTASGGVEWQPWTTPLSLFADAGFKVDDSDEWFAHGGLTFHFGAGDKPLIRRHREDDPGIDLPFDLFTVIGDARCPEGTELEDGATCEPEP